MTDREPWKYKGVEVTPVENGWVFEVASQGAPTVKIKLPSKEAVRDTIRAFSPPGHRV